MTDGIIALLHWEISAMKKNIRESELTFAQHYIVFSGDSQFHGHVHYEEERSF